MRPGDVVVAVLVTCVLALAFAFVQKRDASGAEVIAPAADTQLRRVQLAPGLFRVDDNERSVTCYLFWTSAITCVGMLPGDEQ